MEERLAHTQHPAVAQGAADDPAQYIAPAFVGRQHTIHDQERTGADVVGNDTKRLVFQVRGVSQFRRFADQGLEPVSYTHLDVYKRQLLQTTALAAASKDTG